MKLFTSLAVANQLTSVETAARITTTHGNATTGIRLKLKIAE